MSNESKPDFDFDQWAHKSSLSEAVATKLSEEECNDLQSLLHLTEKDVTDLGLKVGARRKLLTAIENLKKDHGVYREREELSIREPAHGGASNVEKSKNVEKLAKQLATKIDFRSSSKLEMAKRGMEGKSPGIYQLQPMLVSSAKGGKSKMQQKMIRKFELGEFDDEKPHKVIMVVGATGSGKTTLINGMVNYIFGVEWGDSYRYKLISENDLPHQGNQAKSQTTWISSYTLYHRDGFKVPYSLTVIDTPGFGDTDGIERDELITKQIKNFFSTKGAEGIDHIDAVGFVIQSALPRLTPTQRYVFDQILTLFGKDIAENIFLMLTFADGKEPQVLSGIKEAELPYEVYFKFNNSALFACQGSPEDGTEKSDELNFDEMFWRMGMSSFKNFFARLQTAKPKSLVLTRDVLNERERLTTSIEGIQLNIRRGLNKLEQLKQEAEIVKKFDSELLQTKDHTYTVDEEKVEKKQIPPGHYITNCVSCNRTCHQRCIYKDDIDKKHCAAMDGSGNCTVCVKKCRWDLHGNFPYEYVFTKKQVTKTVQDLYDRYQVAGREKITKEKIVQGIANEFQAVQAQVLGMTDTVRRSLQRLRKIALKPNPMSTVDYIKILIDSEKAQAKPGFKERIGHLEGVIKKLEYMDSINKNKFKPFQEYRAKIEEEEKAKKDGPWASAGKWLKGVLY